MHVVEFNNKKREKIAFLYKGVQELLKIIVSFIKEAPKKKMIKKLSHKHRTSNIQHFKTSHILKHYQHRTSDIVHRTY